MVNTQYEKIHWGVANADIGRRRIKVVRMLTSLLRGGTPTHPGGKMMHKINGQTKPKIRMIVANIGQTSVAPLDKIELFCPIDLFCLPAAVAKA